MQVSRKQEIYIEICDWILAFQRNKETHPIWWRAILYPHYYGNFYPESELVHNLHRCLVYPEFQGGDIHWLNYQAKIYYKAGIRRPRPPGYEPVCRLIGELFGLIPEDLKAQLNWQGPDLAGDSK